MQASVPKFGSFQPKRSPHQSDSPLQRASGNDTTSQPRRHVDTERRTHRQASKEETGTREASRAPHIDGGDIFLIDRRGDKNNLTYETNSQASLPNYHPPSERKTLGSSSVLAAGSSRRSLLSSLNGEERSRLRYEPLAIIKDNTSELFAGSLLRSGAALDFIPLQTKKNRKHDAILGDGWDGLPDRNGFNLRSTSSSDEDDESEPENRDIDTTDQRLGFSILSKEHARLSEQVKKQPKDSQAWLDYIDFQERWLEGIRNDAGQGNVAAEKRSIAEIRTSLYKEALGKMGIMHPDRDTVVLKMLEEGRSSWESNKLVSKWLEVTSSNVNSVEIQLAYVNFLQSNHASFTFDKCRQQYVTYMALLNASKAGSNVLYMQQSYAVLRFTFFARESGYAELAIGIWQALLEFNFPELGHFVTQKAETGEVLRAFEDYWDGEAPRVGDLTDAGLADGKPRSEHRNIHQDEVTAGQRWYAREMAQMSASSWPARTTDEDEDPDKVILFSDVEPFLFKVQPLERNVLINAFLCYHQLPALIGSKSFLCRSWWMDAYLRKPIGLSAEESSPLIVTNAQSTTDTLFGNTWLWPDSQSLSLICSVFRTLAHSRLEMDSLREYYLALLLHVDPLQVKREGRELLKTRTTDLCLYNAYALAEGYLGNNEISGKVLATASNMSSSLPPASRQQAIHIMHTQAWQAVRRKDANLTCLYPIFELARDRDIAYQQGRVEDGNIISESLLLEHYVRNDYDLCAGLDAARQELAISATIGEMAEYAVELLHQAQARLISHHTEHVNQHTTASIRRELRESVEAFPNNTMLLNIFVKHEARFIIDDRIRQSILTTGVSEKRQSVISWAFDIGREMSRYSANWTTAHSVRATFERAVGSKKAMLSEAIWTEYLRFEHDQGDIQRMKGVFYRGVLAVPWCKEFAMLAFLLLGKNMTSQELRSIYNMMQERELRMHVGWNED